MENTFDTHAVVQRLRRAGLSELQAEDFVGALVDSQRNLATKQDLKELGYTLTIRTGAMIAALGAFLSSIKFFA